MKAITVLVVLAVLCFLFTTPALAVVEFQFAPSYNFFQDSRITGQDTALNLLFDLNDLKVGYLTSQGEYTITDETNSANDFNCMTQVNALSIMQGIASFKLKNDSAITTSIGLNFGTISLVGIKGTVSAPDKITQTDPLTDILVNISYDGSNKNFNTHLFFNLGYRFANLKAVNNPFNATPDTRQITSLNGFACKLGIGIGF